MLDVGKVSATGVVRSITSMTTDMEHRWNSSPYDAKEKQGYQSEDKDNNGFETVDDVVSQVLRAIGNMKKSLRSVGVVLKVVNDNVSAELYTTEPRIVFDVVRELLNWIQKNAQGQNSPSELRIVIKLIRSGGEFLAVGFESFDLLMPSEAFTMRQQDLVNRVAYSKGRLGVRMDPFLQLFFQIPVFNRIAKGDSKNSVEQIGSYLTAARRGRILFAENDIIQKDLFVQLAKKEQLVCESVVDGSQVIERFLDDKRFDCIVIDRRLIHMDGPEAVRRLRQLGYTNPIIGLTASTLQSEIDEFLSSGIDQLIQKPFSYKKLLNVIKGVIKGG